eukprot:603713-Hanusia_phi.AAC.1
MAEARESRMGMEEAVKEVVAMGYRGVLEQADEASLSELRDELKDLPQTLAQLYRKWSLRAHPDKGGDEE